MTHTMTDDEAALLRTVCDDCYAAHPHLFYGAKVWVRDREWCRQGQLTPPPPLWGRT